VPRSTAVSRRVLPPSPPAEKATARQDQAGQSGTGDGTRHCCCYWIDRHVVEINAARVLLKSLMIFGFVLPKLPFGQSTIVYICTYALID
jgi:hypothetical protein